MLREERRRESGTRGASRTSSTVSSGIGTGQPGSVSQKARRSEPDDVLDERLTLDRGRMLTLVGIVGTAVAAFFFGLDIGVVAITAAVLLSLHLRGGQQGGGGADRLADRPAHHRDRHLRRR